MKIEFAISYYKIYSFFINFNQNILFKNIDNYLPKRTVTLV